MTNGYYLDVYGNNQTCPVIQYVNHFFQLLLANNLHRRSKLSNCYTRIPLATTWKSLII
jgi:hypothetical protein